MNKCINGIPYASVPTPRVRFWRVTQVPTYNSCSKCAGSPAIIHDRTPDCCPVFWAWMTSQLNEALIRKLRGSLMCLAYFLDMLSVGVCTTRHLQTPGQMVKELNVRNVIILSNVLTSIRCNYCLVKSVSISPTCASVGVEVCVGGWFELIGNDNLIQITRFVF